MAHVHGVIPEFHKDNELKHIAMTRAELEFYKKLAESHANELRNIRDAISQYGYWEFIGDGGETVRLVPLVPEKKEKE